MPAYEIPLRVGSSNVKLVQANEEYPIDIDDAGFTRTGEDGAIKILSLFGGDEMVGEVLEAHWKKGWDSGMDADQRFTAILDGSGTLELEGEADVAGSTGYGWLNCQLPIPLLDNLEIQIAMSVPIDDTGGVANRDIKLFFQLGEDKGLTTPITDPNFIRITVDVDETGLINYIYKEIAGTISTLFSGSTYDDATTRSTGDLEATIWRFVFHGKPGTSGAHVHIYLKQSDTITNAESEAENELTTSPYDVDDLLFLFAYPSIIISSQNTSYYDAGQEAKVGYVKINYDDCDFIVKQGPPDADLFDNQVELWDGDPDSGGIRVYDVDHVFSNDIYLQNGLVRLFIDEGLVHGANIYGYSGGYTSLVDRVCRAWLNPDNTFLNYFFVEKIVDLSPEKTRLQLKVTNSATNDDDYYYKCYVTLERGKWGFYWEIFEIYPEQETRIYYYEVGAKNRFCYVGDGYLGDDDLNLSGENTTMSDNFEITFDDAGEAFLIFFGSTKKPDVSYNSNDAYFEFKDVDEPHIGSIKFYLGVIPFSLIANLFQEAEDATLGGGASAVVDVTASAGEAALLDAQNETIEWALTAGTDILAGRYLLVWRIRDTNQVAGDVLIYIWNSTDSSYRNEINTTDYITVTAAYAFYTQVFDVTETDVDDGDTISIRTWKALADANDIYVDDFLIIPIGNGESWPQDLAHSALRHIEVERRVAEK